MNCKHYNITDRTVVSAQWSTPNTPNGVITTYHVELNGIATYRVGKNHIWRNDTYGPKVKTLHEKQQKADYDNIPFNTNYTIKVSAITRSRKPGAPASAVCSMPRFTPPFKQIFWDSYRTDDRYMIKLFMPELSERNGPICGYRVYLVRMPKSSGLETKNLPPVEKLNISTYHKVHAAQNTLGGAYIAETFSTDLFESEIILGDGHSIKNDVAGGFGSVQNTECRKLLNGYVPPTHRETTVNSIGPIKVTTEDPLFEGMKLLKLNLIHCQFN